MQNDNNQIRRIEQVKSGDDILYTKEIIENVESQKERKYLGLNFKDLVDSLIKIVGLSAIILAWLDFVVAKEDKATAKAEKAEAEFKDSLKSLSIRRELIIKGFRDSIQLERENQRDDTTLRLAALNFYHQIEIDRQNDLQNRRDYEQRNQQFQDQWLNSLKAIKYQGDQELRNSFEQTRFDLHLQLISTISSLLENIQNDEVKRDDIQKFDELGLKIRLLKRDSIYNALTKFKKEYFIFKSLIKIKNRYGKLESSLQDLMSCNYYVRMGKTALDVNSDALAKVTTRDIINDSSFVNMAIKRLDLFSKVSDDFNDAVKTSDIDSGLIQLLRFKVYISDAKGIASFGQYLQSQTSQFVHYVIPYGSLNRKIVRYRIEKQMSLIQAFKNFQNIFFGFIHESYSDIKSKREIINREYSYSNSLLQNEALTVQNELSNSILNSNSFPNEIKE